ncbi:cation-translocating P-type ATPase [Inhella sp.]|uniref:cation-translocating P-type ATPase n=1 Tax=Inhella sp. TaxID=1921806 RepID=UPI0035AF7C69
MSQRPLPLDQLPPLPAGAQGLDAAQVQAERARGFNDIVAAGGSGWREVLGDSLRDPMLWFLLFTAGLFGLLGQRAEALTLLAALLPLLGMDAYLHRRTRASSAGLASRLASSARVHRSGNWQELPARELVVGDLVEVAPGEYFPADGLLVGGTGLQVDESTLTGESLPVPKRAFEGAALPASADEALWASAGTRLLTGSARLRVLCIGADTLYGEIVRSATAGSHAATPLQQAIAELVRVLLVLALLLCALLAGLRLWQGHGWVDALLSAVTLAVAALPEEFPVVYTFFLGVGVFRLARRKALVRRAVAVENIGRVSCLVSDKTGTLTAGSLVLAHRVPAAGLGEAALLELACRAARADSGDPLDQALHQAQGPLPVAEKLADFPFTEARRRETLVWRLTDGRRLACSKGAPETVLDLCALGSTERADWLAQVEALARDGHKVIACAQRALAPDEDAASEAGAGLRFGGLLAFEDPVREGVPAAVAECLAAGMRVIMVTGDHPTTAAAVAREIGLGGAGGTPPRVAVLAPGADPAALLAERPDVVARATPTQKFALVQALQAGGERVAVTGDGVNDVPALRLADVGVAMGERGTRSAREVAAVVLLDDRFRTLVDAVAEGRQLFQNLRLAFAYLLLVHLPLVLGAALLPMLGLPLLFLPIHIVWLELVIHPTAMLAFQAQPRPGALAPVSAAAARARFFTAPVWWHIGLLGGLLSLAVIGSYLHALGADRDVPHARAMALSLLLLSSAALAAGLSGLRQPSARWLVAGTLGSVFALVQWPTSSRLLGLSPLHGADWALLGMAFALTVLASCALARRLQDVR